MTSAIGANDVRELTIDEVDAVSGGFKISAFGVTIQASAEFKGVYLSASKALVASRSVHRASLPWIAKATSITCLGRTDAG
ncbi:MAG: hypothetical protein J0H40_01955 [Rhizobiales bacterium]|nr:hypothetical protein [Hyphomicrobiales bacterium]